MKSRRYIILSAAQKSSGFRRLQINYKRKAQSGVFFSINVTSACRVTQALLSTLLLRHVD